MKYNMYSEVERRARANIRNAWIGIGIVLFILEVWVAYGNWSDKRKAEQESDAKLAAMKALAARQSKAVDLLDYKTSNPYLKRYIDDEQWITSWRDRAGKWRRLRKLWFIIWELTSHCGRSISLWAIWSFVFAIIFGFLYRGHIEIGSVSNWYTPFYFSVVTFTTLGFGDVTPLDWVGQLWITMEVVLGYVMLGGLISIFANKLARRS